MRPIAIVTAVVLIGVFTSPAASQTQSSPRVSGQPRAFEQAYRPPEKASANTPNMPRYADPLRENATRRPHAYRKAQSESWHQPPASSDGPAPADLVTALPQVEPAAVIMVSDKEQPRSVSQPYAKTPAPAVATTNFEAPPKKITPNKITPNKMTPPRKNRAADMKLGGSRKDSKQDKSYDGPGGLSSLVTIVGSLALVIGLFLIVAFLMRRATPTANLPLPDEVVEVLGRAPLANRQQVHLLRCGNKLLLVCVTPNGTETLTEITDPAEVDRLAALCRKNNDGSATANFRQVFQQLAWENNPSKPTGGRA